MAEDKTTLNVDLEDILKMVSKKSKDFKPRTQAESECDDLKKAWFRHMLESLEKLNIKIEILEQRVRELETNEARRGQDKGDNIQPVS